MYVGPLPCVWPMYQKRVHMNASFADCPDTGPWNGRVS